MPGPDLSVVCRNCGSEASPYVTECPYCGTRLRKRAPKLEREGGEIHVKEGRREKKLRRDAVRRERTETRRERMGGSSERYENLSTKPVATVLLVLVPAVLFLVLRASNLTILDLGAIIGDPAGEPWRYLTAPFVVEDAGFLFACGLGIAIFAIPLERTLGTVPVLLLGLACGALGALAAVGLDSAIGDGVPVVAGPNAIALGMLAAFVAIREPERRADPEEGYEPVAVGVAAAVLLLLPLVESLADPFAGAAGAVVGGLCGFIAARGGRGRE